MVRSRRVRQVFIVVALLLICVLPAAVRSDDPVSSSITFSREVIRIFERKCLPCHAPGSVAMSLAAYRDARPWARAIREELVEQRMPPWPAAPGYGEFANDIGLTSRELTMILTWTDGGVPRGDDRDLPPRAAPAAPSPAPDRRLELPVQHVPPFEEHVVRRVTIETGLTADRRVREISVTPGNTRVVRAAFVSVLPPGRQSSGQWVGAWTPWLSGVAPPEDAAFLLPAGARLVVELHYRGRESASEDRSSVALFFADRENPPAAEQILVETAAVPASERYLRARGAATLREDAAVWAILPPSAAGAEPERSASLEVAARRPDGAIDVLLWLPEGRYDWPTPYVLRAPVLLPAGSTITVTRALPRMAQRTDAFEPSAVTLATYRPLSVTRSSAMRRPR